MREESGSRWPRRLLTPTAGDDGEAAGHGERCGYYILTRRSPCCLFWLLSSAQGLPRSEVRVVGLMTPALSLHLLHVTPVVAVIPRPFKPTPNPEVSSRTHSQPPTHSLVQREARSSSEHGHGCGVQEVETTFDFPLCSVLRPPAGSYSFTDLDWYRPW